MNFKKTLFLLFVSLSIFTNPYFPCGGSLSTFAGYKNAPANEIIINKLADLPVPTDLADGLGFAHRLPEAYYRIGKSFTTPYPFAPTAANGDVYIDGTNSRSITYTGTGAFTRTNATNQWSILNIRDVILIGDGSNQLFDVTGTGNEIFVFINNTASNWGSVGTISDQLAAVMVRSQIVNFGGKLTLQSNWGNVFQGVGFINFAPITDSFLRIAGTNTTSTLTQISFGPLSGDSAIDIDAALTGTVTAVNCRLDKSAGGIAFKAGSLDQTDPKVIIHNSPGFDPSQISGVAAQTVTTTAISIPAANTYVISTVTGWTVSYEERITIATDGSFVFNGLEASKMHTDRDMKIDQTTSTAEIGIREWYLPPTQTVVTFTNATNLINETDTALSDGDTITFRSTAGTLPAELRDDIIYYVVSKLTNSFQVAYTSGGAAITFTDDGTPTNSYKLANDGSSEPSQNITAGSPQVLSGKALFTMDTDGESVITVINKDNSNDIRVYTGGYLRI